MASNRKLGKRTDQRVQLVYSQASSLLWHGEIVTTLERAKEVRKVAEKMITTAIRTYEDTVNVDKLKTNLKNEKIKVAFVNDGPRKLAARRRLLAIVQNIPEERAKKEKKAEYKARTKDIKFPLIEKIFREYAPKYDARAKEKNCGGGYTRIIKLGERRGDDASMVILQLV
ncbi:MAG: 50S ribosomal protein L17 [Christensenellaceae bacterium]|jgi:large subunit ribosomal protein L17|nr:50S ribosomal protein L17 [Christensenellaceae bacterium]